MLLSSDEMQARVLALAAQEHGEEGTYITFHEICDQDCYGLVFELELSRSGPVWAIPSADLSSVTLYPSSGGTPEAVFKTHQILGRPDSMAAAANGSGNDAPSDWEWSETSRPGSLPVPVMDPRGPDPEATAPPSAEDLHLPQSSTLQSPFVIEGHDIQYVRAVLAPGETVIAEPGSMKSMEDGIVMNSTLFGDGNKSGSVVGKLLNPVKRALAGESVFAVTFTNQSAAPSEVTFSAPFPGSIVEVDLQAMGEICCQRGAFLCGSAGVFLSPRPVLSLNAAMFGGEGLIIQKLHGSGCALFHAGGSVLKKAVLPGQTLHVEAGALVAWQGLLEFNARMIKKVRNVFAGEGLFLTTLQNRTSSPGCCWIQTVTYPVLAAQLAAMAPAPAGK